MFETLRQTPRRGDFEGRAAGSGRRAERPLSTRCTRASFAGRWTRSTRRAASTGRRSRATPCASMAAHYAADVAATPDKRRFMFAFTNAEVKTLNTHARALHKERGDLGEDHSLTDRSGFAGLRHRRPDSIFWQRLRQEAEGRGLNQWARWHHHGDRARPATPPRVTVMLDTAKGKEPQSVTFTVGDDAKAGEFNSFKHGYAGTIYRGPGQNPRLRPCLSFVDVAQLRRLCRFDAAPRGRADIRGA